MPDAGFFHFVMRGEAMGLPSAAGARMEIHDRELEHYFNAPWVPYVPALTAFTSDPSLGTGGSLAQIGRYRAFGSLCVASVELKFGASSVGAGSGTYFVRLPIPARPSMTGSLGGGCLFDVSGGAWRSCGLRFGDESNVSIVTDDGLVSDSVPWTWAAGDEISLHMAYEIG